MYGIMCLICWCCTEAWLPIYSRPLVHIISSSPCREDFKVTVLDQKLVKQVGGEEPEMERGMISEGPSLIQSMHDWGWNDARLHSIGFKLSTSCWAIHGILRVSAFDLYALLASVDAVYKHVCCISALPYILLQSYEYGPIQSFGYSIDLAIYYIERVHVALLRCHWPANPSIFQHLNVAAYTGPSWFCSYAWFQSFSSGDLFFSYCV